MKNAAAEFLIILFVEKFVESSYELDCMLTYIRVINSKLSSRNSKIYFCWNSRATSVSRDLLSIC